ncbi:MAG: Crp/Fnr family transcriptional regulator [Bacteroidota bacterium]
MTHPIFLLMEQNPYHIQLKKELDAIFPLSKAAWKALSDSLVLTNYRKNDYVLRQGEMPKSIHFLCKGIVIIYFVNSDGKIYSKNLLFENEFPAATASLLRGIRSNLSIKVIEDAVVLSFEFCKLKELMKQYADLKDLYVRYLELNWVIIKDIREISIATEDAKTRYQALLELHPNVDKRVPAYHLSSYLNITPTQLSRIRKLLKDENQHM